MPMSVPIRSIAGALVALGLAACAAGCSDPPSADPEAFVEHELAQTKDDHWFYGGPLPTLESPRIVVSLAGHTARVSGLLPRGAALAEVPPHVKLAAEGDRTRLDAVYPIATARAGKSNAGVGDYHLYDVIPYRPDGVATTTDEGPHMVTWGGFPFLRYNGGIALHGPITAMDNKGSPDVQVWYLQRGEVSGGCNRMMGEHVVELAHVAGINMRKVYAKNAMVTPAKIARVSVIDGYDTYGGKLVDVDFPTDANVAGSTVVRPWKVVGVENVEMFGSWVASTMPNGRDLPPDMKWQGGVRGKPYVFAEHTRENWVCSVPPADLARLSAYQKRVGELPQSFCQKKTCVLDALRTLTDPRAACSL